MTDCCKRPSIAVLHEKKPVISQEGRYVFEPCLNKICTNCHTHWYGHPDSVKQFTSKEWDAQFEGEWWL